MAHLWRLARVWYADRLDPAWRRPPIDQLQARLTGVGLTTAFWSLTG